MRALYHLCLVALLFAVGRAANPEGIALLVPAYFAPRSGEWQRLATAARRVPLVAIANLANGPGTRDTTDPAYAQAIRAVREAGGQVIGYVYTQYGARLVDVVKLDMKRWHELYPLDGFFVDEMSNLDTPSLLDYYGQLFTFARNIHPAYRVVGNPGTNTEESYLKRPTADVVVIFEHHSGYSAFTPAAWTQRYPETQFAHLTYDVESDVQMSAFLNLAVARRSGFIYATDDNGGNPWDRLPRYWEAEVNLIESINLAAAQRIRAQLKLDRGQEPLLTLKGEGAVGRYILEVASPLGDWHPLSATLTTTGTSVWQILNAPGNRFYRTRQQ